MGEPCGDNCTMADGLARGEHNVWPPLASGERDPSLLADTAVGQSPLRATAPRPLVCGQSSLSTPCGSAPGGEGQLGRAQPASDVSSLRNRARTGMARLRGGPAAAPWVCVCVGGGQDALLFVCGGVGQSSTRSRSTQSRRIRPNN